MTDPKRHLGRLDEIQVHDLWSRAEARAAETEAPPLGDGRASLSRRLATIAVAFAVFASGGVFLLSRFGATEPGPPPSDDPVVQGAAVDQLKITCTDGGARVEGDVVELQADGVHVSVRNETDADFLYMRDPERAQRSIGIELAGREWPLVLGSMDPGIWVTGCFSGSFHTPPPSALSARFQVVDPHGYADELKDAQGCGEPLPDPVPTAGVGAPLSAPLAGRLLVQAWDHDTGEGRAFLVDADGSNVEEIDVPGRSIDDAALSPDGSRIVLVIHGDSDGDPHTYYASKDDGELYAANRDGSGLVQLTENQAEDYLPTWTPDGRISFTSNRDGDITIYTMDPDGSGVRRLVADSADAHDWSTRDQRVAYVGDVPRSDDGCSFSRELIVANADGSEATPLTGDELYQQAPAWSPDGSTIAFTASNQSDYAWEIFLVNADGTDLRRITDYEGYDQDPVWSPDGALIAFTSDRFLGPDPHGESQGGLPYVMNADGSGVRPLVDPEDLGIGRPWDVYVTDWRA